MISLLATGGTIACTHDDEGRLVPTLSAAQLAEQAGIEVEPRDLLSLDSSSITLAQLDSLLAAIHREEADKIILTHGTDSMEETSMALSLMPPKVPVVMTGAQRPSDHEDPDGPGNLRTAVEASSGVVFNQKLYDGFGLRKLHTTDLDGFSNPIPGYQHSTVELTKLDGLYVPILYAYPGASARMVASFSDADGVVIAGLGSGNVSEEIGRAVRTLLEAGIPVVMSSRVAQGPVQLQYGGVGGGGSLAELGLLSAGELSPAQARIALLVALAGGHDPASLLHIPS